MLPGVDRSVDTARQSSCATKIGLTEIPFGSLLRRPQLAPIIFLAQPETAGDLRSSDTLVNASCFELPRLASVIKKRLTLFSVYFKPDAHGATARLSWLSSCCAPRAESRPASVLRCGGIAAGGPSPSGPPTRSQAAQGNIFPTFPAYDTRFLVVYDAVQDASQIVA